MNASKLNEIFKQAEADVISGKQPADVSQAICNKYGMNWMFVAPRVKAFKK